MPYTDRPIGTITITGTLTEDHNRWDNRWNETTDDRWAGEEVTERWEEDD